MMAGPPLKALAFWVAQEAFILFVSLSIRVLYIDKIE